MHSSVPVAIGPLVLRRSAATAALLALAACGGTDGPPVARTQVQAQAQAALLDGSSASLVYRHSDGSVPPPHFRRLELNVDPGSTDVVVADRDAAIGRATLPTDPVAVDETLRLLSESDLPATLDAGCVGSPGASLEVSDAAGALVRSIDIPCDPERGASLGELRAIVAPLLAPFDLEALSEP